MNKLNLSMSVAPSGPGVGIITNILSETNLFHSKNFTDNSSETKIYFTLNFDAHPSSAQPVLMHLLENLGISVPHDNFLPAI